MLLIADPAVDLGQPVRETFSGVPFEIGVRVARSVAADAEGIPTALLALRWILDQPGLSTVIPGARAHHRW